ncbi:tRNA modification GTPase MnmE [Spirochaetia bacterium]|nr:tRNA modification GTPase MnmE [Spirochaetia bacterium]
MTHSSYGDSNPIAALATPLSESALAVIRTSGANVVALLASVFSRPEKLLNAAGNTIVHGWIIRSNTVLAEHNSNGPVTDEKIDEVLVSVYRAPVSYTGEEGADISCHGGIAPARAILAALHAAGLRDALPGEFTFRAFMNGKLDLTRAESVMELVSAKTDLSREHAVSRLSGALEREIREIKTMLVQVLAGTELYLDYSEDEAGASGNSDDSNTTGINDEAAGHLPDRHLAEEALVRLRVLAASYRREKLYRDGALAVIAGRPNAGKSSLFNLLLKEERSIVTDIPGTTRDWIESWISIDGIPVRLADTAGLHGSTDPVEKLGMERSRALLAEADLVLYLIDGSAGITPEDAAFFRDYPRIGNGRSDNGPPVIPVWNKVDIVALPATVILSANPALGISAKTGAGIPALTAAMAAALEAAFGGAAGQADAADGGGVRDSGRRDRFAGDGNIIGRRSNGAAAPGSPRQKELIDGALAALEEALALADRGEPLDLIAPALREGVNSLGEITGEVSTADILEAMFSRFCVGK